MMAMKPIVRTSDASELREQSGDRGAPASERVRGSGGTQSSGS
jgi:hypothetical protein